MYNSISIIGAGIIGGAMARILARKKIINKIIATRRNLDKIRDLEELGVIITSDNVWAVENSDVAIISVKPNALANVLKEIRDVARGKLLISVVAGVPINLIEDMLPGTRIVRAMPNIAVLVGESFTVYSFSKNVTDEDREFTDILFSSMGVAIEVEEKYINAYTGLTGSGPAYMSTFIEAMVYAGLKVGIPRDIALLGATQVAIGTGKLIRDGGMHYAKIKEMVVTPAGTTIEGLFELEEIGLRRGLMKAVYAATQRAEDISKNKNNTD